MGARLFLTIALLVGARTSMAEERRPTVAILYFDYAGANPNFAGLSIMLTAWLITDLENAIDNVDIVERTKMAAVQDEITLNQTNKVDRETAVKIGKLLGAQYLVMGTYLELSDAVRADARIVEVETGRIVKSVGGFGDPGEIAALEQKLSRGLAAFMATIRRKAPPPEQPATKPPPLARPSRVTYATGKKLSQALREIDMGNRAAGVKWLKEVLHEQPDFTLAQVELTKLIK